MTTPFEVCHFPGGFWAALGRLPGTDITIDSHGVPLAVVELERMKDPLPEMHAPPPPPPEPSERFPDELRDQTITEPVTSENRVDLMYRERSRLTGSLAGTPVDLNLMIPWSTSSASGSMDGKDICVAWETSDNSTGDPELPASLQGTFDGQVVSLRGVFHMGPGIYFDWASVEGDLGAERLAARIDRAGGGLSSVRTICARGTFGNSAFNLFGSVNASLDRAILRGDVDGDPVHVTARQSDGRTVTRVSGSFPGPAPLALIATATLLFFI
ncbi:MAG TPA: hypothetical protein VHT30_03820 [Acidimicrobiales bacterium]|nr:hypothetical protein [Acidimicrobiales bacterium]